MSVSTDQNSSLSPAAGLRVAVISGSVRKDRMGPTIAQWVAAALDPAGAVGPAQLDLIDVAHVELPDDSLLYPGGGPKSEVADRIAAADAFVFVTPECNHSYPASLKRLIDWHYGEWRVKPATIVAYGVHGGYAAIEHLRGVLAELSVVTTRRALGLRAPWTSLDDQGRYTPDTEVTRGLTASLAELRWWAEVLADARRDRPLTN
ncbi:NAD(P)H-dependent oxidoreductase [Verrucosispora sp. WMMA2121]|uniref:NADPH-dependent FMN reductase n=1 Tax=Verrucosispora sp. WMMA2121 TaxID=3015164 RepID=UPI0022B74AFB|nr:NAD(P)H-dependent oxidoreductase [Verrucosispora sp. WMMA2121]MCZ7422981.1 NAD(P)H-dependent oxidoreductase [Verrucosispora sp. WMMA2121]